MFRLCLAISAPYIRRTNCPEARDLAVVKFSALYDPCNSQKRRKTEIMKIDEISVKVRKRSVKVCKRSVKVVRGP